MATMYVTIFIVHVISRDTKIHILYIIQTDVESAK